MAEYIEREAFIEAVKDIPMWGSVAVMFADSIPAADVAPVVHGRWLCDGDFVICSQCEAEMNKKNSLGVDNFKNYCPNCGAKMDIEVGGDGDAVD